MSVTIYTTPTCQYCKMAKQYFQENNIDYTEYDVSENEEKRSEMVEKSGQMGVPVIDVEGQLIVGFDKSVVAEALESSEQTGEAEKQAEEQSASGESKAA
ncbi:MAG: NrdH-redoxin [Parcubacteria group bacterium SW_4_49_11]|nr:MAG: NrdH-redoxin [Parcubacteria group bacterium SW_4_49_11]